MYVEEKLREGGLSVHRRRVLLNQDRLAFSWADSVAEVEIAVLVAILTHFSNIALENIFAQMSLAPLSKQQGHHMDIVSKEGDSLHDWYCGVV